ncbi:MAG: Fe-S cluster assembly protein SufD [Candidatus Marinimicrobia bacterium]|nr:Fe-S cluster assembly protein SufD [Candidatus Neomarinimicrobiota bacterium]
MIKNKSAETRFYEKLLKPFAKKQSLVNAFQEESYKALQQTSFPTLKDEEWKYTDIGDLAIQSLEPAVKADAEKIRPEMVFPYQFNHMKSHVLVFINGYFSPHFSHIKKNSNSILIENLSEALSSHPEIVQTYLGKIDKKGNDFFSYLNGAFFQEGVVIDLRDNVSCEIPIHLLYLTVGNDHLRYASYRNIVILGKGSSATLVETHHSLNNQSVLTNTVTEIVTSENATLQHHILQLQNENSYYFGSTNVSLFPESHYQNTWISLGGKLSRNDVNAEMQGEGSDCQLYGLYAGHHHQLMDSRTVVTHNAIHATSNQLYKGILNDCAQGNFNGKIYVSRNAQKTEAYQLNRNLILSEKARVNTKPHLKIFADDVKCSHGASVGQLDKNALFYLQSRGVGKEVARSMLTFAFANDVIDSIILGSVRFFLYKRLYNRFGREWGSVDDFESFQTIRKNGE